MNGSSFGTFSNDRLMLGDHLTQVTTGSGSTLHVYVCTVLGEWFVADGLKCLAYTHLVISSSPIKWNFFFQHIGLFSGTNILFTTISIYIPFEVIGPAHLHAVRVTSLVAQELPYLCHCMRILHGYVFGWMCFFLIHGWRLNNKPKTMQSQSVAWRQHWTII